VSESSRRSPAAVGVAIFLAVAVVGCSSAATPTPQPATAVPTATASPLPATPEPTLSVPTETPTTPPTAEPTVEPTLEPTPVASATPHPPAAPRSLTWSIPCQDTFTCTGWAADPVQVNWTRGSGSISGFRLYYTPGDVTYCPTVWHATGARRLIGTFGPTYIGWRGRVSTWKGKFSIVAFNAGGDSPATLSGPVDPSDHTCP
jgi:hypothetical protein